MICDAQSKSPESTNIVAGSILLETSLPGGKFVVQDARVPEPGVRYSIANGLPMPGDAPGSQVNVLTFVKEGDERKWTDGTLHTAKWNENGTIAKFVPKSYPHHA